MSSKKLQILICGGGNGAHCFTGVASSNPNIEVKVLTLYENEADRWSDALKESSLTLSIYQLDGTINDRKSTPLMVTKDPKIAMDGVDIVFIVVPSYVHQLFLETIVPLVKPNTLIVGLPGHAGFEIQCKHILDDKARDCTIVGFESLPWACRILTYGKHVQMLGYKDSLSASFLTGIDCKLPFQAKETIQGIFGDKPRVKFVDNVLAITLMAGSIIHPPIMYGKWKDWDGTPVLEKPLFYQGVDEVQANLSANVSNEVIATARKIQELRKDLDMSDVIHISDWFKSHYHDEIADDSSLMMSMKTNSAYNGLVHPMNSTENGFVPDFQYRYLSEDVPFGLVVMKGLAEIVGTATPTIDEIIIWTQDKLGKEYIINSKLVGKDAKNVRAPQSFGLVTLDQLLAFITSGMR